MKKVKTTQNEKQIKNSLYKSAKKAIAGTRVLGILYSVELLINLIMLIIANCVTLNAEDAETLAVFTLGALFGLGIPELVMFILLWVKYKAIKFNTNLNHKCITVGYPVVLGIQLVFEILLIVNYNYIGSTGLGIAMGASLLVICILLATSSFIFSHKIKTTVHR